MTSFYKCERTAMGSSQIKIPVIVAYGGGINSTAMLIGMRDRGVMPDLILMADTGGENPETVRWLGTFAAWLRDNKMPALKIVRNDGMYDSLEHNCVAKNMLPSLAYGFKSCSDKYKRRPQDKYCNHWEPAKDCWAAGEKCIKYIGYDADEERRAKIADDDKYVYEYPLLAWEWGRDECVSVVAGEFETIPPKSSCFFCPAMKKQEVLNLKRNHPHLFDRAIAMERGADLSTVKGLGRSWSWEALGRADDEQMSLAGFLDHNDEPCGCYDGDYEGIDESVINLTVSAGCKKGNK